MDFIILLLYVDDILIVDHDARKLFSVKGELSKFFAMKHLGPGTWDQKGLGLLYALKTELHCQSCEHLIRTSTLSS